MTVAQLRELLKDQDGALTVLVGLKADGACFYAKAVKIEIARGPVLGDVDLVLYIEGGCSV